MALPGSTGTKPGSRTDKRTNYGVYSGNNTPSELAGGSNHNTIGNNTSHGSGTPGAPAPTPSYIQTIPGISPGSAAAYGSQLQALLAARTGNFAGIKAQQGVLKAQKKVDFANIKAQLIENMRLAENQQIERGGIGSSAAQEQKAAIAGEAAAARLEAKTRMLAGLQQLKLAKGQGQVEFLLGTSQLAAQRAAEQAAASTGAYASGTQIPGQGGNQAGGGAQFTNLPKGEAPRNSTVVEADSDYLNGTQLTPPKWYTVGLYQWHGITMNAQAISSLQQVSKSLGYAVKGSGYRSYQAQVDMVNSGNENAADPGHSYHQLGLAIDLDESSQTPQVFAALRAAGWHQLSTEPWHWSYRVSG